MMFAKRKKSRDKKGGIEKDERTVEIHHHQRKGQMLTSKEKKQN